MSVDHIETMKEGSRRLSEPDTEESIPKKLEALDILCDIIEDLDNARDLHLVGAFQPVVASLGSVDAAVRAGAANIILICVQVSTHSVTRPHGYTAIQPYGHTAI